MAKGVSKQNGRVLIVEDEESELRLFEIAFGEVDDTITVTGASNGEQAVESLKHAGPIADTHLPDVVILDLDPPKSNGMQVLRRFRDDAVLSEIPTVICSHHSNRETVDACYELGANAYFVKPFDYEELRQIAQQITTAWAGDAVNGTGRDGLELSTGTSTAPDRPLAGLVHEASKMDE